MYSGWSPFLRTKFWKKELVGKGVDKRWGEKKVEGSGRTVDWVWGKRKGWFGRLWWCEDGDMVGLGDSGGGEDGSDGVWGL